MTTENLLVGFLRLSNGVFAGSLRASEAVIARLPAEMGDRLRPDEDPLYGQGLAIEASVEAALRMAATEADASHSAEVEPTHLLAGILEEAGPDGLPWFAADMRLPSFPMD